MLLRVSRGQWSNECSVQGLDSLAAQDGVIFWGWTRLLRAEVLLGDFGMWFPCSAWEPGDLGRNCERASILLCTFASFISFRLVPLRYVASFPYVAQPRSLAVLTFVPMRCMGMLGTLLAPRCGNLYNIAAMPSGRLPTTC